MTRILAVPALLLLLSPTAATRASEPPAGELRSASTSVGASDTLTGPTGVAAKVRAHVERVQAVAPATPSSSPAGATGAAAWREQVDAAWGPGLDTEDKLFIFDRFWKAADQQFAAWQGIEHVDWAALRERYRPEIEQGVSRGRFAAIMDQITLALRESHTVAEDKGVAWADKPRRGVPLLWAQPWGPNLAGVCATAQDDGSALVYAALPDHPLGLEPGDRVLGYDGRPWDDLYRELLAAELPISKFWWGSSPSSLRHTFVAAAPLNWHLFESMDVADHATGRSEQLPTAAMAGYDGYIECDEQLPVAGVPKPQLVASGFTNVVSWGFLPGTRIGYVYVVGWFGDAGEGFTQAVEELTQQGATDGLIIDFRLNLGGNMFLSDAAAAMLFDRPTPTVDFAYRLSRSDHALMRPAGGAAFYAVDTPTTVFDPRSYDRPIAVLTGPGALSSGDQVALRMSYHPRARTFGKSTATAFNAPTRLDLDPDWYSALAIADAYRVEAPLDYLTHDEFVVDEPVWLAPDDVAVGRDTVVESALRWIRAQG